MGKIGPHLRLRQRGPARAGARGLGRDPGGHRADLTPVFVNPTMLGVMPGYYNSAVGMTATFTPTERTYLYYGIYDGDGAGAYPGGQTGLEGPNFNGSSFQIGEVGYAYRAGPQKKPGNFGVGVWGQIGQLRSPPPPSGTVDPVHRCPGGLSLRGASDLVPQPGRRQQRRQRLLPVRRQQLQRPAGPALRRRGPDRLRPGARPSRRLVRLRRGARPGSTRRPARPATSISMTTRAGDERQGLLRGPASSCSPGTTR